MRTTRLLAGSLLLAGSVLAACGDDDSDEASTSQPSSGSATTVSPATAADEAAADNADAPDGAGAGVTECPDASELAPLYGAELELDEAAAMTGAIGLVFCPYLEVLAPGATNAFGGEEIPDEFSLTFTDQNIVVPGGGEEEVSGVGEAALWSEVTGLSVWTGEQGLIVSLVFPPPAGDAKTVSIAIAEHVLA
jgi:hypothetical protein